MLFMVIEHFKNGDPKPVGDRFKAAVEMLPEGVVYLRVGSIHRTPGAFKSWKRRIGSRLTRGSPPWDDLVDFEVVPVQTSAEFWATVQV